MLSIEFKCGAFCPGRHPTDEQSELVHGAKFQGTFHSIHSVVTEVMNIVQFSMKVNT